MKKLNIYEVVTNKIIEQLEKGEIPWQKPWDSIYGMPCNMISKKPYRGINTLLLGCLGYESPFFMTFKQVNSLGGSIKKGRIGIFADTGLGKTLIQITIAENIIRHTNKRVLILTPLALAFF